VKEKPFFHMLSEHDLRCVALSGITWRQVQERFNQPPWCGEAGALEGQAGCWSLVRVAGWDQGIRCFADCGSCEAIMAGCPEDVK
jgi:hypothetical protein